MHLHSSVNQQKVATAEKETSTHYYGNQRASLSYLVSWNTIENQTGMGGIALLNTQYFHVRFLHSQQGR